MFYVAMAAGLLAQSIASPQIGGLDDAVERHMRKHNIPGLAIGVLRAGKVEVAKGYGFSNLEKQLSVDPGTVFQIGSVTKQFTAAATMILIEQGKMSLEDPIGKFYAEAPASWREVTIRHCLTHTSGIRNVTPAMDWFHKGQGQRTAESVLRTLHASPLDFAPGARFKYSNTGYMLLGAAIENASSKSFAEFLSESIFQPLGMSRTSVRTASTTRPYYAIGYQPSGLRMRPTSEMGFAGAAAGGVLSNIPDLVKWIAGLEEGKLLNKESVCRMWQHTPLADGTMAGYGFGWSLKRHAGRFLVEHGGGVFGFNSQIHYFPEERLSVIILANTMGAQTEALANEISTRMLVKTGK